MSGLYKAMASAGWGTLNAAQRQCRRAAAQADDRERSRLPAHTLRGDEADLLGVRDEIDFDEGC